METAKFVLSFGGIAGFAIVWAIEKSRRHEVERKLDETRALLASCGADRRRMRRDKRILDERIEDLSFRADECVDSPERLVAELNWMRAGKDRRGEPEGDEEEAASVHGDGDLADES